MEINHLGIYRILLSRIFYWISTFRISIRNFSSGTKENMIAHASLHRVSLCFGHTCIWKEKSESRFNVNVRACDATFTVAS
jgi:hypothetical protein